MNVGERIHELRKLRGFTRDEFAKYIDIPSTTLRNYELGTREPGHPFLVQMAYIFNVSTDYLLGLTDDKSSLTDKYKNIQFTDDDLEHLNKYRTLEPHGKEMVDTVLDKEIEFLKRRSETEQAKEFIALAPPKVIPSYQGIAGTGAGTGQYVFDDLVPDMIEVDSDSKADFVIDVRGDSMIPTYNHGDGLLVKKQGSVDIGEIGIFMVDNEAYVKECGGDRLISHNKKYPDILLKEHQDIRCIGKVLGRLG